ncbi:carbon-nitrogen family hydrolase [Lysinibacillus telephonicus]|uniref:Carbon-nitrogen family hydrolase n=1 Tax=Lysinibacillus telephonicus TaxID=1714840 RepID=A0A431UVC7_9BACI|nr:carbon-nitrogen family hydrolase [Lysinibacillus telephonicus]RTQ94921.1 carbon-nitrogen family hydrolase [Lysinibacillus telephonicus]
MKIGCIQMNVGFGKVDENFERAEHLIREAAGKGAEIVVLPEMWNTGYALEKLEELADSEGARTKAFLKGLAEELSLHIVGGSVATERDGKFYNTMYVYNRDGELVSEYSKVHLFRLMNEEKYLEAGNEMNRFTLGDIEAGGVICYDIRFPEWLRAHALAGANVLFVSAQWPTPRIDHWKTLLQARAIENQCFVIAVNRISRKVENFNGQSMVIEPWGEVLWTGGEDEELAIVDVDFSKVEEVRGRIPVYDDRRPGLYAGVVEE